MLRWLVDENVHGDIVRGIRRRHPTLDLLRVQDVGLSGVPDPDVLAWAAEAGRVLLTRDITTVTAYAYERLAAGLPMPGVVEIPRRLALAVIIEEVLFLAECAEPSDVADQIIHLPLRTAG